MKFITQWVRGFRETLMMPVVVHTPYTSRMITSKACGHGKETAHMQLKMPNGFRGIVCPGCHRQARVSQNLCQCKLIWHQCTIHRHDLAVHRSEKPQVKRGSATITKMEKARLSLHRVAPEAIQRKPTKRRRVEGQGAKLHSHGLRTNSATPWVPKLDVKEQPLLAAKFPHLAIRRGSE